jgi:DNA-binding GntR family transcriptional regulator
LHDASWGCKRDQTLDQRVSVPRKQPLRQASSPPVKTAAPSDNAERLFKTGAERIRAGEPTAGQEASDKIKLWIMSGRIVPGQKLTETDLSAELGVSKGPVREAIQRLVAEGIMEFTPYRGSRVRELGRDEIKNVFDILELVDGLAARRAAENIALGQNQEKLKSALTYFDSANYTKNNIKFDARDDLLRTTIYEIANNDLLEQMVGRLQFSLVPIQLRSFHTMGVPPHLLSLVRSYIESILAGDARAAEAGSRAHMRALRDHILELPDDLFKARSTA